MFRTLDTLGPDEEEDESEPDSEEEDESEPEPFHGFTSEEALEAKQKARETETEPFHGFTSEEALKAKQKAKKRPDTLPATPEPDKILRPTPQEPATDPESNEGTPSGKPETDPSITDLFEEPHSKEEDDTAVETNDFTDDDLQPEQDFRFAHEKTEETERDNDDESESDDETGLPKRVRFST